MPTTLSEAFLLNENNRLSNIASLDISETEFRISIQLDVTHEDGDGEDAEARM
jgi:hypothetical protein